MGAGAIVTSAFGSSKPTGSSFAQGSIGATAHPLAVPLRTKITPDAAPPPPVNTDFVAGWALGKTADTTETTTFKAPKLTCTSTDTGVGPGAFIFSGPSSSEVLDGAGVLVQCISGKETIIPALIVGGLETNFTANKVFVGDNLIATTTVGAGGTSVTLQNTAAKRAFTLNLTGSDTAPDVELIGAFGTSFNGASLPLPTFAGVQFKATNVDGASMGSQTPEKFLFTDDNCAILLQPGAFDATKQNFKLAPPPIVVDSLSPTSGPIGTSLVIAGGGFNAGTTVTFKGGVKSTTVTHTSSTQITAKVPNAALSGPITLTNAAAPKGTGMSACSYTVTPSITSFTPPSGITGSTVTITGGGFKPVAHVKFGAKVAKVTSSTATQIKAVVPNGAITAPITVTTGAGSAVSATNFTPTLSITSFTPTSGPTGTTVTINGVGFTSTSTVKFNGVASTTVTHTSATVLKAKVPTTATSGPITVTNTAAPVGTVTSAASYTVTPHVAPTVTGFTPTSGPAGTVVTITGTNFSGATSIKFGGVGAPTHHVDSPTQITATVPAGAVTGPISVTTAAGTGASSSNFTVTA